MRVGGVTAIGLREGVPIYADERLFDLEWVIRGAGSRDAKIKLAVCSHYPSAPERLLFLS